MSTISKIFTGVIIVIILTIISFYTYIYIADNKLANTIDNMPAPIVTDNTYNNAVNKLETKTTIATDTTIQIQENKKTQIQKSSTTKTETKVENTTDNISNDKNYNTETISKHNNKNDCWIIVDNKVLDVTTFIDVHPGGKDAILQNCGKDATGMFNSIRDHAKKTVKALINKFTIGTLSQ